MKSPVPQSQARLFGQAGESVTRSDRRQRELWFASSLPPLTARPNRRREDISGLRVEASPLSGAPNEGKTGEENLTPVGHPFISDSERRFAPKTVRQDYTGVRQELEWVSDGVSLRILGGVSREGYRGAFYGSFPGAFSVHHHRDSVQNDTPGNRIHLCPQQKQSVFWSDAILIRQLRSTPRVPPKPLWLRLRCGSTRPHHPRTSPSHSLS